MQLPRIKKPQKPTPKQVKHFLWHSFIIVLGNAIASAAAAFFIVPTGFVMGGTTGIGIFVRNILNSDAAWAEWVVQITIYVANIALFVIGAILLGKKFAVATGAGTILYPSFMAIFNFAEKAYERRFGAPMGMGGEMGGPFLTAVCGALIFGVGLAIVIRVGASTGGTDIPPLIMHKYLNIPVAVGLWVLDMTIVLLQLVVVPVENVLYGIVITLVSAAVIEFLSPIGTRRTQVKIISERYDEIREMIVKKVRRGVTVLYGQTGYLKEDCHMLLTVISNRELVRLRTEVQKIDPNAFMTISVVSEVHGRGFTLENIMLTSPEERRAAEEAAAQETASEE